MPKVTEAHSRARMEQILEAAFRCLARKGYSRTTIRDIAAEAGLSLGTLYLYFDNKEDLVRALGKSMREKSDAKLEQAFPEGTALDIICAIFELVIRKYNDPEFAAVGRVDLEIWSEALNNPGLRSAFTEGLTDRLEKFSELITRAQREELSPAWASDAVARVFMAMLMGLQVQKLIDPKVNLEAPLEVVLALLRGSFAHPRMEAG